MLVVIDAELFAELGSGVDEETVAVSVMLVLPPFATFTVIVRTLDAPDASAAADVQDTIPVEPTGGAAHTKPLPDALTNVEFVGSTSVMVTPAAEGGQPFVAVMVYVRFAPTFTVETDAPMAILRSATAVIPVSFRLTAWEPAGVLSGNVNVAVREPVVEGVNVTFAWQEALGASVPVHVPGAIA